MSMSSLAKWGCEGYCTLWMCPGIMPISVYSSELAVCGICSFGDSCNMDGNRFGDVLTSLDMKSLDSSSCAVHIGHRAVKTCVSKRFSGMQMSGDIFLHALVPNSISFERSAHFKFVVACQT